jgi:hypothetical protein
VNVLRRIAARLIAILSALICLGALVQPAQAAPPPLHWGARVGPRPGESELAALSQFPPLVGRQPSVVRVFRTWEASWPDSYSDALVANGQLPMLSIKPIRNNGTRVRWADLAAAPTGSQIDLELRSWAQRVGSYPGPIYVAFNHEPEAVSNLSTGNATEFIAAWRHFVEVFRDEGATNVKFIWIMTDYSFWINSGDRRHAPKWYPGDEWVDAVGADAYNWFTCRGASEPWRTLESVADPLRRFALLHPDEEAWLPEFGSVEDPNDPQRKAQWLVEARELFKRPGWEQFKGVSYFHFPSSPSFNCNWYVDSSQAALNAYRAMGADPFYGGEGVVPPNPTLVQLVVSNSTTPTTGDAWVRDRLTSEGFQVTLADDDTVTGVPPAGTAAILISASVNSSIGSRFSTSPVPVLNWKPWAHPALGLSGPTANVDFVTVSASSIVVPETGHPLTTGMPSPTAIFRSSRSTGAITTPAPGGQILATINGRAALMVVPQGGQLYGGGAAAACRVAYPGTADMSAMTGAGIDLFVRTVSYTAQGCPQA